MKRSTSIEQSPFPYQGPLRPEEMRGRVLLREQLAERLDQRKVTALLGPRRYGKTSVLRRVVADLEPLGVESVWIDFYGVTSISDVVGALDRGLASTRGKLRKALDAVAGGLSIQLGLVGVSLSKPKRERPDPLALLWSLLDVLVRSADRHEIVVVMDEFSGLAHAEGAAAILRTALQHHYREMGLVFAGSDPSTMRMLFTDRAQPFFGQADLVEIGPLTDSEVTEIVASGFDSTGRDVGPVTAHVIAMAQGHPQRAMQLADAVWQLTPPGTAADLHTWDAALEAVRASVDSGSERLYALLPAGHQKTLRVIAAGGSVYGSAADAVGLPPGTAKAATDALTGSGFLMRTDSKLEMVDPLLADWLRRRLPL